MIVEIKNRSLFISCLSTFKTKKKVDFTVNTDSIMIESIGLQKYYLSIPNTVYSATGSCEKFTINPKYLISSLTLLGTDNFEIQSDFIRLYTDISSIKIPFISTIDHTYEEVDDIYTRFVVQNKTVSIFSNMTGLVKYEIEDEKLFIRKVGREVIEEIEIKKLSFIETGELSFLCNNEWTEVVTPVINHVENVLFLFSANILSVQFLFKNDEKIYFEIQIPKSLVD